MCRMVIRLAQQQGVTISHVLGIRPKNDPMSDNEFEWWMAFKTIAPLASEMDDLILQSNCTKSIDWFDPLKDDEYLEESVEDIREANRKYRESLKDG